MPDTNPFAGAMNDDATAFADRQDVGNVSPSAPGPQKFPSLGAVIAVPPHDTTESYEPPLASTISAVAWKGGAVDEFCVATLCNVMLSSALKANTWVGSLHVLWPSPTVQLSAVDTPFLRTVSVCPPCVICACVLMDRF